MFGDFITKGIFLHPVQQYLNQQGQYGASNNEPKDFFYFRLYKKRKDQQHQYQ